TELIGRAQQMAEQQYQRLLEQWNTPNRPNWMQKPVQPEPMGARVVDELVRYVEGKSDEFQVPTHVLRGYAWAKVFGGDWLAPPGVKLIHVIRLARAMGMLHSQVHRSGLWWYGVNDLETYRNRCAEPFGLRELDAVVAAVIPDANPGLIATA